MKESRLIVKNPMGIHIRVAVEMADLLKRYTSRVVLINGEKVIDARDPFAVLNATLMQGAVIRVQAQGEDEERALKSVIALIQSQKE